MLQEIDRQRGLRGSGPAPRGYIKCLARPWSSCTFSRDFSTGRFTRIGTHYHPLVWVSAYDEHVKSYLKEVSR